MLDFDISHRTHCRLRDSQPNRTCHRLVSHTNTNLSFQGNFYILTFSNFSSSILLNFAQFAVENWQKSKFLPHVWHSRKNVPRSNCAYRFKGSKMCHGQTVHTTDFNAYRFEGSMLRYLFDFYTLNFTYCNFSEIALDSSIMLIDIFFDIFFAVLIWPLFMCYPLNGSLILIDILL